MLSYSSLSYVGAVATLSSNVVNARDFDYKECCGIEGDIPGFHTPPFVNEAPYWNYGMFETTKRTPAVSIPHDDDYCSQWPCDGRCPVLHLDRLGTNTRKKRKKRSDHDILEGRDIDDPSHSHHSMDEDIDDGREEVYHRVRRFNMDVDVNNMTVGISSPDKLWKAQGCKYPDVEEDLGTPGAFEEQLTDCLGNPLPDGIKFYKPFPVFETEDTWCEEKWAPNNNCYRRNDRRGWYSYEDVENVFNAYIKPQSSFHFAHGQFTIEEAHAYCNGLGMQATHVWCPGSEAEMTYVWAYHPDQPIQQWHARPDHLDWQGYINRGIWTGIVRHENEINQAHGTDTAEFFCGTNHTYQWYDQKYFHWSRQGWRGGPNWGGAPYGFAWDPMNGNRGKYITKYNSHVGLNYWYPVMQDDCATGSWNKRNHAWVDRMALVCEMNCDLVNVDPVVPEKPEECDVTCEYMCYRGKCICESCFQTVRPDGTCTEVSQIEDDIHVDNAIPEILHLITDESIPPEQLGQGNTPEITTDEITDLTTHGCHCAKMARGNAVHLGGGTKIDAMDQICNKWHQGRKCIFLPGGQCHGQDVSGQTYKFSFDPAARDDCIDDPTPEEWEEWGRVEKDRKRCYWWYYPTVTYDCSMNSDPCLKAICEIDGYHIVQIIKQFRNLKGVDDNFSFTNDVPFQAVEVGPDTCGKCEDCLKPTSCHGEAPNLIVGHD